MRRREAWPGEAAEVGSSPLLNLQAERASLKNPPRGRELKRQIPRSYLLTALAGGVQRKPWRLPSESVKVPTTIPALLTPDG